METSGSERLQRGHEDDEEGFLIRMQVRCWSSPCGYFVVLVAGFARSEFTPGTTSTLV